MSNSQQKKSEQQKSNNKKQSSNQQPAKKKEIENNNTKINVPQQKQSFLSKFKDKHSIISKEGLISLLQNKKKEIMNSQKHQNNKMNTQSIDIPRAKQQLIQKKSKQDLNQFLKNSKIKQIQQDKIGQIIKSRSLRKNSDSSIVKSAQLYEAPKKLPTLHKITSHTHSLRKKDASTPISDIHSVARSQNIAASNNIVKRAPLKIQAKFTKKNDNFFDLDRYALDHLDYLEKFEERIKAKDK